MIASLRFSKYLLGVIIEVCRQNVAENVTYSLGCHSDEKLEPMASLNANMGYGTWNRSTAMS